jgi:hypothetical protein
LHERFLPGLHPFRALLCETNLPRANSQREQVAVVAPIDESLAWARRLALQERQQIDAVEVDLEGHAADRVALPDLLDQIGLPGRGREGRDEVLQRADVVDDPTRLDNARPPHHARHAPAAFPVGVLLAAERARPAVRPARLLGAVVGREDDHRVVGQAQFVQLVE